MRATHTFTIGALFHFLLLVLPLYFSFSTQELFEFNKMLLVYGVTILIAAAWLVAMIREKTVIFARTPLDIPIMLFLLVQVAATIFSIHPYTSLWGYYSRFHGGLASTIAYIVLFYAFASMISKKQLSSFFMTLFMGASLVGMYAILEHFGHSVSCLLAPGAKSFGVECWVQDVQSRVFATFGQPNWLAAYCVLLLPVGISLLRKPSTPDLHKLLYAFGSATLFLALLFTRSRSGMLAAVASIAIVVFFTALRTTQKGWKKAALWPPNPYFGATIVVLLSSLVWFGSVFTPSLSQALQKSMTDELEVIEVVEQAPVNRLDEGGTDSSEIRKIVWQGGLDIWKRYPLLGSGPETFAYSYYTDRPREHNDVSEWDFLYNKAHNELINLLATTGAFGLATYLFLWGALGYFGLISIYKAKEPLLISGLLAGLAALFVSNFFGFSTVAVTAVQHVFFAMVLIAGDMVVISKSTVKTKDEVTIGSMLGYTAIGMIAVMLLQRVWQYRAADETYLQAKSQFGSGLIEEGIGSYLRTIQLSPKEALWYDSLSEQYSTLALQLYAQDATPEAQVVLEEALTASDQALLLNNQHLNFYKTRIRVLANLSRIQPELLTQALTLTAQAQEKSPTDAKLVYTEAILHEAREARPDAVRALRRALQLKPDYLQASWRLVELLAADEQYAEAITVLESMQARLGQEDPEILKKITELEAAML